MEVKTKITIEIEGEDCKKLKSALDKVVADINRIGLKHLGMTTEESELIKDLTDKLT